MTLVTMADPKWPNLQIVEVQCDHCNASGREHGETVDSAIAKLRILGWTIDPGDHSCMYHKDIVTGNTHSIDVTEINGYKFNWRGYFGYQYNTENEFRGHVEGV